VALRSVGVGRTAVGNTAGVAAGVAAGVTVGIAVLVAALVVPGRAALVPDGAAVAEPAADGLDAAGADAAGAAIPGPTGCRCGHDAAAHEHFRPGSDCGACGAARCGRFRATRVGTAWHRWRAASRVD
jgi:hypothetical protein